MTGPADRPGIGRGIRPTAAPYRPARARRWGRFAAAALLGAAVLHGAGARGQDADRLPTDEQIEQAVVSVDVTRQPHDWYSPWQRRRTEGAGGSGFLIGPGLVLTNAHVVSDAKQILLRLNGDSAPYYAEVAHIAHDSDLALLRVADPKFGKGVLPLRLGDLPSLRTRVRTYGFPVGGDMISRTEGVVSRVQFITYAHTGADSHLAIQTDSAINPGNSGGPVTQRGLVVGVAFQSTPGLNDVGYFIPTPVINRFLRDIQDGRYDGYGELGLVTSGMVNPAYRGYLGLPDTLTGVTVDSVLPRASGDGLLHAGDVVTEIDGAKVANDGTIKYFGHAVSFEQLAEEKLIGERVTLRVWRDRKALELPVMLKHYPDSDRLRSRYDYLPPYFIYAGLVFMELSQSYLETFGNPWQNAPSALLLEHFYRNREQPEDKERRAVVLIRVLPHDVNTGYRRYANKVVATVNGVPIEGLRDVVQGFRDPVSRDFHRIEMAENGGTLILDKAAADRAHLEILLNYGIQEDRRLP
ncbi:MAG: trypsin-like peptidase domain-containing protein [Candidatus Lambdaproteobacteria bacterium]|nr:trypsin-like peptidase domain-containing protein [Candidatus Lambdaproteobacteria bacterium]